MTGSKYEVDFKDRKIGDILLYKFGRTNCHAAFYLGDNTAIHSHIQYGVVEFDVEDIKMKKHFNTIMRWNGEK